MNAIKAKLNNNSGISILFAILFLLVVTIISAVMIASASANLTRVGDRHKTRQEYLTLKSCADIMKTGIGTIEYSGMEYEKLVFDTKDGQHALCGDDSLKKHPYDDDEVKEYTGFSISGQFDEKIKNKIESVLSKTVSSVSFKMEVKDMPQYGNVIVTVTMDAEYNLKFNFKYENGKYSDFVLTYPALVQISEVSYHYSHPFDEIINEDGSTDYESECSYTHYFKKTHTVWGEPVLSVEAEE